MKKPTGAIAAVLALLLLAVSCAGLRHFRATDEYETGLALFNRGQYEDAIPHFQKATEEDPDFAEAYFYLGRSYVSTRRWREAIQPLRTAYRLAPAGSKDRIFDVLLDALLAAGLPPDRPSSDRSRELP